MKTLRLIIILILSAIFLSGCGGLFPTAQPEAARETGPQIAAPEKGAEEPPDLESQGEESGPIAPTEDRAVPTAEAENEPEPAAPEPVPVDPTAAPVEMEPVAVKQGLVSSDPEAVNLASGEIQLVEFFAFW